MRLSRSFRPFAPKTRRTIVAIVVTFVLVSTASAALSIWATGRSRHRAAVLEIAARQRTLAERYVADVLLVRAGDKADPRKTGTILALSAKALLDGGTAPAVDGDDDETVLPATTSLLVRGELQQEGRLVNDLTATGNAFLGHRPVSSVHMTAGERLETPNPVQRIRVLAALTSNVSLNAARTIAAQEDRNITDLIMIQVGLGFSGLIVSLLLAWALVTTTRRQTAHFRSLVTSSTDLVLVLGEHGCRYASTSVAATLGRGEADLFGDGYLRFVHEDDRAAVGEASRSSSSSECATRQVSGATSRLT